MSRPNVLLITVDDMNYDAPGFASAHSAALDVTPNIDALARQSRWFVHAHVAAAICQPSRQAMMTGRYPHNNGAPGFHPIDPSIPTLQAHLREAGFINGILGKVDHLAPQQEYRWEHVREMSELGQGRDPGKYYRFAAEFLDRARSGRRPFFFMANSHDPHRPFAGSDQEKHTRLRETGDGYPDPSRIYHPGEIQVPGFLPNLPEVRREVAEYLSSCRRADDTVGAILKALDESGEAKNTIIIFLSDNGMAFPYAKANCYLSSTRTPLLVRWPGRVTPGVDRTHFICGVDFMPTILEIMRLPQPGDMDGTSFLPLLCGESQSGRESVFTTINTLASARAFPMRCLQNHRYGYIFNAWSDGQTVYRNESQTGRTWAAMQQASESDPAIAARVDFFSHRVVEELYDLENDPACLNNLATRPEFATLLGRMRVQMREAMEKTSDPQLELFIEVAGMRR